MIFRPVRLITYNLYHTTVDRKGIFTGAISRDNHSHKTCRTIRDQDQNGIKQSRSYLELNQAIKECLE